MNDTLTAETETELIRAAQAGDGSATGVLLDTYSPALRNAARRFSGAMGAEDASQEAIAAFLECLRDFDADGEVRLVQVFGTIVQRKLADAAAQGEDFKIPPREYRRYLAVIRQYDGDVEVAARTYEGTKHLSRGMFLSILRASRGTHSLDGLTEEVGDGGTFDAAPFDAMNPMYRPTMPTPSEIADVHYALSICDERERLVCRYAYGFAEARPMSDAEVSEVMPVPTERGRTWTRKTVNDTRRNALVKMRAALLA